MFMKKSLALAGMLMLVLPKGLLVMVMLLPRLLSPTKG
ncbi:secreted protein [Bathymodiolus azoricus thioautotrophic gill symbiont]|uniref:Secreted protein n=1 Tax=Bathymodiolus azoricus thioautotrophic gill symbiont TaxID=235205 RepID=A0A1H6K4C8_9GAMM|nr:secreted protein [Bathymodiolus azoricus thioautotrophic gill symbiont]